MRSVFVGLFAGLGVYWFTGNADAGLGIGIGNALGTAALYYRRKTVDA